MRYTPDRPADTELAGHGYLRVEPRRLRKLASRETQVSRQVELNQQLAQLRAALSEARAKL